MNACLSNDSASLPSLCRNRFYNIARWGLLVLLIAVYPLARRLPERSSWENGWVEDAQLALLLAGFACAAWTWSSLRRMPASRIAPGCMATLRLSLIALAFWLLCAGRETSWGATFLTPGVMEVDGPYFTSSKLWYHMAIKPLVLLAVAMAGVAFLRWRLDRPLIALMREHRFPWFEVALVGGAAVMATLSESSMFFEAQDTEALRMMVEELAEAVCYLSLLLVQARLFDELRSARAGTGAD